MSSFDAVSLPVFLSDTFCLQETPRAFLLPIMSNNYPYRPPPSDPDPGPYSSSDRQPALSDSNLYRPPQESFSSSYPSSSSSFSRGAPWSQDSALNILSSCGLEPGDLALLAELPEDVLTSSAHRPAVNTSTGVQDHPHTQLIQYPTDHIQRSLSSDTSCWGNPSSVQADPSPSSSTISSSFHHRPGLSEYGKTGAGPGSSQDFRNRPGPSEYVPSKKEALDFHGTCPQVFPYSCSLCDITVMSERVWIKHVNESQHADGQLRLLQQ
ncbi:hypothetical protein D5F01_LYC16084 [Larimichthys crocea]|uniref:Uncharacterized protein n=1 Tax=Larimichthys crocea TaxID=215358 RepID=A0A6G0I4K4_LARCR|nr:hypothetical protein D5F01_LYC16084 [Larimichthys crocea]